MSEEEKRKALEMFETSAGKSVQQLLDKKAMPFLKDQQVRTSLKAYIATKGTPMEQLGQLIAQEVFMEHFFDRELAILSADCMVEYWLNCKKCLEDNNNSTEFCINQGAFSAIKAGEMAFNTIGAELVTMVEEMKEDIKLKQ